MAVSIGMIGAGTISGIHVSTYKELSDEFQVAGVCDIDEERASQVADEFDTRYWTDYETFVTEAEIDAVDITLPHHLHYPVGKAALEAGKHVLVEKPFATAMADCLELVDLAERNDLTLMVAQQQRYHPPYQTLKTKLDEDVLGTIRHGRIDAIMHLQSYGNGDPPLWFYKGDKAGGGPVISLAVHKIDLLRYFIGDARRAIALGDTTDPRREDSEDFCVALIEFENGALVDLFTTHTAPAIPYDEMFWLFGDSGVIHTIPEDIEDRYVGMHHPRINLQTKDNVTKDFEDMEQETTDLPTEDAFANEFLHFAECIQTGQEPLSSGRDNVQTMALIFAIYESLESGGTPVSIDVVIDNAREE